MRKERERFVKNKAGRIVSKRASANGKAKMMNVMCWISCLREARRQGGSDSCSKGTPLYKKAKEIYMATLRVRKMTKFLD